MQLLDNAISGREVGEVGISIATSVAVESLFANDETIKEEELWINVRTLFRNLHGSIDGAYRKFLTPAVLTTALLQEMEVIPRALLGTKLHHLKVHFYSCSYKDLKLKLPNAIFREAHTPLQLAYQELEQQTMNLIKSKRDSMDQPFHIFQTKIRGSKERSTALILTHSPIDLLFHDFSSVRLLESHTGAIKSKVEWNTKLTNGKILPPLPFNKFTVQVFGDNNTYLSGMPTKIKEAVIEMAEKDHWHQASSLDRILVSINKMKDKYGAMFLKSVLRS